MSEQTLTQAQLDDQARADRIKVGHLVAGLVFLGGALTWALHAAGVVNDLQTGAVFPVVLVVAGVVGLVAMVAQGRRGRSRPTVRSGDEIARYGDDTTTDETDETDERSDTVVIEEEQR